LNTISACDKKQNCIIIMRAYMCCAVLADYEKQRKLTKGS